MIAVVRTETGLQLYARLTEGGSVLNLPLFPFFEGPVYPGEICEICFEENAPIQDMLLNIIVATLLYPEQQPTATCCSEPYNVIYVDLSDQFSCLRLICKLDAISRSDNNNINSTNSSYCESSSQATIIAMEPPPKFAPLLERFHYIKCPNGSADFTHAMEHIADLLLLQSSSVTNLLVIDSLTAVHGLHDLETGSCIDPTDRRTYEGMVEAIRKLIHDNGHRLIVLVTQLAVRKGVYYERSDEIEGNNELQNCALIEENIEDDDTSFYSVMPALWDTLASRSFAMRYNTETGSGEITTSFAGKSFSSAIVHKYVVNEKGVCFI